MTPLHMPNLNEVRNLYKQFREQQPSSPNWFPVIDACIDLLMQNYISELEERAPMVGLED